MTETPAPYGVTGGKADAPMGAQTLSAGRTARLPRKKVSAATSAKTKAPRRKFHNVPVVIDGHRFDSTSEGNRYTELRLMERAGEIRQLEIHPRFPLVIHEQDCGVYVADFAYLTQHGERVVEDVKSPATRKLAVYRLKKRQVWALYGIDVREVMA